MILIMTDLSILNFITISLECPIRVTLGGGRDFDAFFRLTTSQNIVQMGKMYMFL